MSLTGQSYEKNAAPISLTSGTAWTDACSSITRHVDSSYHLMIDASWVADVAVAAGDFRITVNDVEVTSAPAPTGENPGILQHNMPIVTTGYYTVKLQCRRSGTVLATLDVATGAAKLRVMHASS